MQIYLYSGACISSNLQRSEPNGGFIYSYSKGIFNKSIGIGGSSGGFTMLLKTPKNLGKKYLVKRFQMVFLNISGTNLRYKLLKGKTELILVKNPEKIYYLILKIDVQIVNIHFKNYLFT